MLGRWEFCMERVGFLKALSDYGRKWSEVEATVAVVKHSEDYYWKVEDEREGLRMLGPPRRYKQQ